MICDATSQRDAKQQSSIACMHLYLGPLGFTLLKQSLQPLGIAKFGSLASKKLDL
jgi:hypothetical protein